MKVTKNQLRRIIKEERAKLLSEASNDLLDLEFAIDEFVSSRVADGETDASVIHRAIVYVADKVLKDASLADGVIDKSRY